jgi:type III secretion protein L
MSRRPEYLTLHPRAKWVNSPAIVKAADLSQLQRAAQLIEAAHMEAAEIRRLAAEEYERQRKDGYENGYKEAGEVMLSALTKENENFDASLTKLQGMICDVVAHSIKMIIDDFDDFEKVVVVVSAALHKMRGAQSMRIQVAPEQICNSEKLVAMLRDKSSKLETIEVLSDATLSGTRVIIETPLGRLQTSIDEEVSLMALK